MSISTGSSSSRRGFLKLMTGGTCGAVCHRVLGPLGGMLALVRPLEALAATDKILVVLNFSGGVSYNITPPYAGQYLTRNPNVGYNSSNSIQITNDQGLHPSLTAFKSVWDSGNLAVMNLVGYANANRSHDESTQIWQTGNRTTSGGSAEGWGARLTSQMAAAFGGVSLSGANPFSEGGQNPPRIVSDLGNFGERQLFWGADSSNQFNMLRTAMTLDGTRSPGGYEYVRASFEKLEGNKASLASIASMTLPVTFPNTGLGQRMEDAARLIAAGPLLGAQVIFVEQGGYDTHADERGRLTQLLNEVNGAVAAFVSCMQSLGKWNNVVLATMSEFTRTMENNSRGTDHGAAGPLMVMGGSVAGGQKSPAPNDAEVGANEYIRARHLDFTQVYGSIVNWMGYDAQKVFPYLSPTPYLQLF